MDDKAKSFMQQRLEEAHARATRNMRKLEIDLGAVQLEHQRERIYKLMEYHLRARATARLAIEELEKL